MQEWVSECVRVGDASVCECVWVDVGVGGCEGVYGWMWGPGRLCGCVEACGVAVGPGVCGLVIIGLPHLAFPSGSGWWAGMVSPLRGQEE